MLYEDVELLARKQFMLDIGLEREGKDDLRIVLNRRHEKMPEGRRLYREEEDFFRLIVFGADAFILSDEKLYEWSCSFYGNRKPEFMLNFHNLRQLDRELKKYGFMIEEVQECFLPSFIFFDRDDAVMKEEVRTELLEGETLTNLIGEGIFPHALVGRDKAIEAIGFKPSASEGFAAAAGAQRDGAYLWQTGVDVLEEYRDRGIATELVYQLTERLIGEGKLPFYGVRPGNIISKKVAVAAGFEPAFSEVFVKKAE